MIDYVQITERIRGYMYLGVDKKYYGKYLRISDLLKRSDCVVPYSTLTTRLTNAINGTSASKWTSVMQCMTKIIKADYRNMWRVEQDAKVVVDDCFLSVMQRMPINNSKPRIMQSIPIKRPA